MISPIPGHSEANPSNILYRGDARDFHHAMMLVRDECRNEIRIAAKDQHMEPKERTEYNALFESYVSAADTAEAIHAKHVQAAAEEMKQHEHEDVRRIGEALATGDFSTLAI